MGVPKDNSYVVAVLRSEVTDLQRIVGDLSIRIVELEAAASRDDLVRHPPPLRSPLGIKYV